MTKRVLAILVCAAAARAQPGGATGSTGSTGATGGAKQAQVKYEDLPPAVQMGLRAESIQRAFPTLSTVVIVRDAASYTAAIGSWSPLLRFPVLIDDGTPAAREDIARFVRGFAPKSVVRWSTEDAKPIEGQAIRAAADSALWRVWARTLPSETEPAKVESQADLVARWKKIGVPRTGVVIATHDDAAWTAALALAAGRAQPLVWVDRPGGLIDAELNVEQLSKFESAIESACESTGMAWKGLGDDIDAVTVCMGIPGKVRGETNTILAMTDVLARTFPEPGRISTGARWAWAGQIFGTQARSAYAAMCSLFLAPKKAWLFDGYPGTKPWSDFDATAAAANLKRGGLETVVDDTPRTGERAWRVRSVRPIEAGLIAVNTKGMANEFWLEPGRCVPADVPMLDIPAMVYFVHSWSAVALIDRNTVGGRWMERGAYAYMGSVDEPYLQAFVPTPIAMGRLLSRFPFAAAVRPDDTGPGARAWKLTVIGDPLTMVGIVPTRVEGELPLARTVELQHELTGALERKDFVDALRTLTLQGRDADVVALVNGLLKDDAKAFNWACAEVAILPLARMGERETLVKAYELLPQAAASQPELRDALWHVAYQVMPETRDAALLSMLRVNIRDDVRERDTLELAPPLAAVFGHEAALAMIEESRVKVLDPTERPKLDEEARRHSPDPRPRGR